MSVYQRFIGYFFINVSRKTDREYASHARNIAHAQNAVIQLDAATCYRQAEPKPGFIRSELLERQKHLFCLAWRETTAMILYFNKNLVGDGICIRGDVRVWLSKFECVLYEITERRIKKVAVAANSQLGIDCRHHQAAPA